MLHAGDPNRVAVRSGRKKAYIPAQYCICSEGRWGNNSYPGIKEVRIPAKGIDIPGLL